MLSSEQQKRLQAAVAHHLAGRFPQGSAIYEPLRVEAPDDYQVNHLLGLLRHQQGRNAEAVPLLEKACTALPNASLTHMVLGLAQNALGRRSEADKSLSTAVALDPKSAEAWSNLGGFYVMTGRAAEAIKAYRHAINLNPKSAQNWVGLGTVFHIEGRSGEAIEALTKAINLDPSNPRGYFARGQALQACHRCEDALADFEAELNLRPGHHEGRSFRLFLLNYRSDLTREFLFTEHLAYARAVESEAGAVASSRRFTNGPDPARKIRLAFLSPDLRSHSVAYFLEPLLDHLDPARFELLLYHDHFSVDHVSERLRARAAVWRHFAGMAAATVEEAILGDRPDVLVDLTGHTGFNRMELLARRLAPIQISYLGYPNTTGLRAVDYRFTDAIADPPGESDRFYTEKLIRFAPTAWAYAPPTNAPEPSRWSAFHPGGPPRSTPEPVTFGSFNALSKVQPATLRLWREVLAAVPHSKLILKSSGMEPERWRERLAAAGFAPEQFELLTLSPDIPSHLATYSRLDVALDPFPYNGTTTTCEALWMGVPVVTLAGDRHAARVGASLLTAIGRKEWVARSSEEYVRIAASLAADAAGRGALRTGLREEMRASPLFDYAGQAEKFSQAVRACWEKWCAVATGRRSAGDVQERVEANAFHPGGSLRSTLAAP